MNPMRNIEWKVKKEGPESEDSFQVTHLNGFTSEENGVTANCGDLLEMLNYALEDYISRSGNDPRFFLGHFSMHFRIHGNIVICFWEYRKFEMNIPKWAESIM